MPECVGISKGDSCGYADDTSMWVIARDLSSVERTLNERGAAFARYATRNGLVLNASKTQLMIGGNVKAKDLACLRVVVGGIDVEPTSEMELLGVRFDAKFSTAPHDINVALAARRRAGLVARLSHHIPRGEYLSQLARGLVVGKLGYAIAAVVPPRLTEEEGNPSKAYQSVQVAINDVARTITGKTRKDHIRTQDLLRQAGLPSINELAVRSIALEAWKAFGSTDGSNGSRNPIGNIVFPLAPELSTLAHLKTRSQAAGIVPGPLRTDAETFAILQDLKDIISVEKLYDESNPVIIIGDRPLEVALGMKALHLTEIRMVVCKQLISQDSQMRGTINEVPQAASLTHPNLSVMPGHKHPNVILPVIPPTRGNNPGLQPSNRSNLDPIPPEKLFRVKPKFLKVIRKVPDVSSTQEVFTYQELTRLLSQYIIMNKNRFFDERNIKVALCQGDILGEAFGLRAFHRTQVTSYLRSQLIPYSSPMLTEEPDSSSTPLGRNTSSLATTSAQDDSNIDTNVTSTTQNASPSVSQPSLTCMNTQIVPHDPKPQLAPMTLGPSPSLDLAKSRKRAHPEGSGDESQSSSSSKKAASPAKAIAAKRRRSSRSFSVVIHDFSSSSEETIYSEQGYETVVLASVDESDNTTEVGIEDDDDFTEFEVDTDAERSNPEEDIVDSAEDSDIEDVVFIASSIFLEQDTDFWADSESAIEDNDSDSSGVPLWNFDPEMGVKGNDHWKCRNCNEPNTPLMSLCSRCWKARNGWVPSRLNPRKKRKRKEKSTKGQPTKNGQYSRPKNTPLVNKTNDSPSEESDDSGSEKKSEDGISSVEEPEIHGSATFPNAKSTSGDSGYQPSQESCPEQCSQDTVMEEQISEGSSGSIVKPRVSLSQPEIQPSTSKAAREALMEPRLERSATAPASNKPDLLCNFCLTKKKNAGIVHGRIVHQICCYSCAKKLYKKRQPCPLCRRKIEKICVVICD
eukprot:maker-scaffold555_size137745-snap-gene-0.25 protein:Tk04280 transcript:maker-scaffold555_size137745-snap-gene-0.25-mRNA-1 annotation:"e3 ubiquitin-protein ligase mdm2 isoform x1"